ncbi:hypothetical protein R3P38DRAFT_602975 [Favolaschia claudopus]|uniref:Uncharacterized protein n=1 Tax=Favolaschia claudopus TaxID=2862362 RepID=A0AAW0C9L3_9AGAR
MFNRDCPYSIVCIANPNIDFLGFGFFLFSSSDFASDSSSMMLPLSLTVLVLLFFVDLALPAPTITSTPTNPIPSPSTNAASVNESSNSSNRALSPVVIGLISMLGVLLVAAMIAALIWFRGRHNGTGRGFDWLRRGFRRLDDNSDATSQSISAPLILKHKSHNGIEYDEEGRPKSVFEDD